MKELGRLIVPILPSLPETGSSGQVVQVAGVLHSWDGAAWVPNYPIYIQATTPANPQAGKWLWVNTSGGAGDNATLWVQDGT